MLEAACLSCSEYKLLHWTVKHGIPKQKKDWYHLLQPYYRHRHLLTTIGPAVMINDKPVVPTALKPPAVDPFHSGYPRLSTMCLQLSSAFTGQITKMTLSPSFPG